MLDEFVHSRVLLHSCIFQVIEGGRHGLRLRHFPNMVSPVVILLIISISVHANIQWVFHAAYVLLATQFQAFQLSLKWVSHWMAAFVLVMCISVLVIESLAQMENFWQISCF